MILHCSFEELSALTESSGRVLAAAGAGGVAAPPETIVDIEALASRIGGDLEVESLQEIRSITRALGYLLSDARTRTDIFILEQNPAAEAAILSYFEYGHLLALLDRSVRISEQMAAMIELMTGQPVTEETARGFSFPD